MKCKQIIWLVAAIVVLVLVGWAIWRSWPSRGRMERALIDLYIKIFCER